MSRLSIAAILLLEGLASAGVQMLTLRQVVPFVGSSVLSTSIVVSAFLAALAVGYYWGGRSRAEHVPYLLVRNLLLAIVLFAVGLSFPFIEAFFLALPRIDIHHPLIQLAVYCGTVVAPLVFLLAQTVPLLLHTSSADTNKSAAAGNLTALSTVGNVMGCLVTALVLMVLLSVGYAVWLNTLLLALALACLIQRSDLASAAIPRTAALTTTVGTFLGLGLALNVLAEREAFIKTTPYSNIEILTRANDTAMIVNRSYASRVDAKGAGWPYIEMIKAVIDQELAVHGGDVLVLGAGGFTLSAGVSATDRNYDYVDVDKALHSISSDHFLPEPLAGTFEVADARQHLLQEQKAYPVIVTDLYTNAASIPGHASTVEFFRLLRARLIDGGLAVFNIASNPTLKDTYSRRMDATLQTAFDGQCLTQFTDYSDRLVNVLYLCRKTAGPARLYSDHQAGSTIDGFLAAHQAGAAHGS